MVKAQSAVMEHLAPLAGKWRGRGKAEFPTISTFEYREELEFVSDTERPLFRYEQRTFRRLENGEFTPSHWEIGFWRVLPDGQVQVLNAQSGGRVEISHGPIEPTPAGFRLTLQNELVAGDPRMIKTSRRFELDGDEFRYTMDMSTTGVSELSQHVSGSLVRAQA